MPRKICGEDRGGKGAHPPMAHLSRKDFSVQSRTEDLTRDFDRPKAPNVAAPDQKSAFKPFSDQQLQLLRVTFRSFGRSNIAIKNPLSGTGPLF